MRASNYNEYLVSELGINESIPEMILSLYPDYSLNDGQDKMSYEFKFLKCDESDFDDYYNFDEEHVTIDQDEMDEKTQEAYDDLWCEYMAFKNYGIKY